MKQKSYSLQYIVDYLSAKFHGDANCIISGIGSLANALPGQLAFLKSSNYKQYLSTTKASAIIIRPVDFDEKLSCNFIIVNDPYLAYAKVSKLFDDAPELMPGIHPTAVIGADCEIAGEVSIGLHCVIGKKSKIGKGVSIGANCVIGDETIIGEQTKLCANVTLYHKVKVGKQVLVHSGAVIGSDGFGNANDKGVWHKIYQLGTVIIGNSVEIGANTTIDRGTIGDTIIEDGVKIDNLVQIGHNVHIGAHTAIAGCTGIAGSTKIGRFCMIGGGVGISGHIEIADRVILTARTNVDKSITEAGGIYASGLLATPHRRWWRILSRLMQLDELVKRLKIVEKKLL